MGKQFMNSAAIYNTDSAASWSDTDGFYKRVNWLSLESHAASNDDEDIVDYFMCLEQFHYEIEGAIKTEKDQDKLEHLRLKTKKWVYDRANQNKSLADKREIVSKYQRLINKYAHQYGLYLRKSVGQSLDSWDNE